MQSTPPPHHHSSSSSSSSSNFSYDVFISFRGPDTRHGFTGHLYKALSDKGIRTFIDDKELQRGDEITSSLLKSIENSRIAIIIFSKNYASSSFCLDELAHIIHYFQEKSRLVLPVFYNVEPTTVRNHTESYANALAFHKTKFQNDKDNMERFMKWKIALKKAADLSGYHFKLGKEEYEYMFITEIVTKISKRINLVLLHVADHPVGLESKLLQVKSLLDVDCNNGVCMIGICGNGGLGKTTLTRAIYNLIADQFEGLCFLHDVRENSTKYGLKYLQEQLLSKTIGYNFQLPHVSEGISIIKQRLHQKKVLLILDDVDTLKQLQVLVGEPTWFGCGSRVIITTRDKHLLSCHGIKRIYELDGLNEKQAIELFMWMAFKSNKLIDSRYDYILERAVKFASGLPLALEVVGSNLFGKPIEEWESTLDKYERIPHKDIHKTFKVSFDALDEEQQNVFLDIACCFKGCRLEEVKEILHCHYGHCIKSDIEVLVDKSLIKISWCQWSFKKIVTLHDLIEAMGKEVLRQQSPKEPGERNRLWCHDDIVHVLQENMGTSNIEMIYLNCLSMDAKIVWNGNAFKKMKKLKTLIIENGDFSKGPKYLPSTLKVLKWNEYTLRVLNKEFKNLKILELENCKYLTDISLVVSYLPNLESISLKGSSIKILPECLKKCRFLKNIDLDDCEYLEEIRGIPPNLKKLSAIRCKLLTASSKSMLMSQELHEDGGIEFYCFPSLGTNRIPEWFEHQRRKWSIPARIPEWYEHQRRKSSINFSFRNKLPSLVFFFSYPINSSVIFVGPGSGYNPDIIVYLLINDSVYTLFHSNLYLSLQPDHTYLLSFDVQYLTIFPLNYSEPKKNQQLFESMLDEELLKNKWIRAEVSLEFGHRFPHWELDDVIESGLHLIKDSTNKDDFKLPNSNDYSLPWIDKQGLSPPPVPPQKE